MNKNDEWKKYIRTTGVPAAPPPSRSDSPEEIWKREFAAAQARQWDKKVTPKEATIVIIDEFRKEKHQYKYSIIDVAQKLAGHVTGTGDQLARLDFAHYQAWLEWRITRAWEKSLPKTEQYDIAVRMLAVTALSMCKQ